MFPQPTKEAQIEFYNNSYRETAFAIAINGSRIDVPIAIPWSGVSFQRFKTFYDAIMRCSRKDPGIIPKETDTVIDFGGYQGMFLYAFSRVFRSKCIVCDVNEEGVNFAKNAFGLKESRASKDISSEVFSTRPRFVTLVHAFEHLENPNKFLSHLKKNVIQERGYLYIEVPNLFGFPLSSPTHFFTYSAESLRYVLESNGFEIIDIFESGFPDANNFLPQNPRTNLVCLAQAVDAVRCRPAARDPQIILSEIRFNYRRHSISAVKKQFKRAVLESARLVYYSLFSFLVEPVFPSAMVRLDQFLKTCGRKLPPRSENSSSSAN